MSSNRQILMYCLFIPLAVLPIVQIARIIRRFISGDSVLLYILQNVCLTVALASLVYMYVRYFYNHHNFLYWGQLLPHTTFGRRAGKILVAIIGALFLVLAMSLFTSF